MTDALADSVPKTSLLERCCTIETGNAGDRRCEKRAHFGRVVIVCRQVQVNAGTEDHGNHGNQRDDQFIHSLKLNAVCGEGKARRLCETVNHETPTVECSCSRSDEHLRENENRVRR